MKRLSLACLALATAPTISHADGFRSALESKSVIEGAQEVLGDGTLGNGSQGLGNGIIRFNRNLTRADIKVTFSALEGEFTRLHLHCNVAGLNGPIAVGLVDLVAIAQDNSEVSTLDSNTVVARIRNAQLPQDGGPCNISNLRTLANEINNGGIYFNLHTTAFPPGELRGQIEPLEPVRRRFKDDDDDD
ncbi:MAG: CHRD domain-containing protein [Pseudomonadota bacterium]